MSVFFLRGFIFSIIEYSLVFYFFNFQMAGGAGHRKRVKKRVKGYLTYLKSHGGFDGTRETWQ